MMKMMIAALVGAGLVANPAMASVNDRQHDQGHRVVNGWKSGELTARESRNVARQQYRINRTEQRMRADGSLSRSERVRLHYRQDRASANIYAKKHNARDRY
jgi:hypothetical protein